MFLLIYFKFRLVISFGTKILSFIANLIYLYNFLIAYNCLLYVKTGFIKKSISVLVRFSAVTSQWLSIAWTVCFGRSQPISVHSPTMPRSETMNRARKNRTGIHPGSKTERDANTGKRHTGSTHSTRCVLFLNVAKHVSEFVSMCLGTSEIMWLMIYEIKYCRLSYIRHFWKAYIIIRIETHMKWMPNN